MHESNAISRICDVYKKRRKKKCRMIIIKKNNKVIDIEDIL